MMAPPVHIMENDDPPQHTFWMSRPPGRVLSVSDG